jgi:hypothetical protein
MKQVITYNGVTYVFVKEDHGEHNTHFTNRVWWIVKILQAYPQADPTYVYNLSNIWSNIHHFGVEYSDDVMTELDKYNVMFQPIETHRGK